MVLLLLASIVASGCAGQAPAQVHHEPPPVERPLVANDDLALWRTYYEAQFRVHTADVLAPADLYPVNAREAYRLELQQWRMQELAAANRQLEEPWYGVLGVIVLGFAGYGAYALVKGD